MRKTALALCDEFSSNFFHMEAVEHPKDIPNEVIGKGGNITYAGRRAQQFLDQKSLITAM